MDRERWLRIDAIIQTAVELADDEREPFLDEACSGDDDLRAAVEHLLAFDGEALPLVEGSALDAAASLIGAPEPALKDGEVLGPYEVSSCIGAGGMGEVYLARDVRLGRKVALKLLPTDSCADAERVRRFRAEARAASALNHPNILTVFEIGEHDGRVFIATEYIEGETLRRRLSRGALTLGDALNIAAQTTGALAAAHRAGIVHRDVKPENIMIRPDGYVKVLDFGLATLSEEPIAPQALDRDAEESSYTQLDRVIGTVRYMSPEQARGEFVDARGDVFSLGVVVFEMITGRLPFDGSTDAEVVASILNAEAEPIARYAPGAPDDLQRCLDRTLRKNPEGRYATASELAADLSLVQKELALEDELARRSGRGARTEQGAAGGHGREPAGRVAPVAKLGPRMRAAAVAATVIAVGFAAYWGADLSARRWPEPFGHVRLERIAGTEATRSSAISPDGRYLAEARVDGSKSALWVRDVGDSSARRLTLLSEGAISYLAFSPDSQYVYFTRNDYDAVPEMPAMGVVYRVSVRGGEPSRVVENVYSPASPSPDGSRFAFSRVSPDGRSELVVATADGASEVVVAERRRPDMFGPCAPAWSPDGRTLAVPHRGLTEFSLEDGVDRPIGATGWGSIEQILWFPDGRGMILCAAGPGEQALQIWYVTYPEGEPRRITNDLENYGSLSLTRDAKTLVAVKEAMQAYVWVSPDGDVGRATAVAGSKHGVFRDISWTPDGSILVPGTTEAAVVGRDGSSRRLFGRERGMNLLSVAPNGRYVVFTQRPERAIEVWRADIDGRNPVRLAVGNTPTCSPDGWVVYTGPGQRLWRVPIEGGEPVPVSDVRASCPSVSPDGRLVACWYQPDRESRPRVAVVDLEDGRLVRAFDVEASSSLDWTPDGRAVCFVAQTEGAANVWAQPLAGGAPRQVTRLGAGDIYGFDWSPFGLLYATAVNTADTILIEDLD
jgi:Tol biopolymer transport system component